MTYKKQHGLRYVKDRIFHIHDFPILFVIVEYLAKKIEGARFIIQQIEANIEDDKID